MKDLINILSADILQSVTNNQKIKSCQLNSIINLLIKMEKEFTLTFTPQTSTTAAVALLVIGVQPNLSLTITINFDSGAILF